MLRSLIYISAFSVFVYTQDIGFPESPNQRLDSKKPVRQPLFVPGRCPDNQYLWPGDQSTDWICDCAPGFIYYPKKDGCFGAYRQGPCPAGQHLILKPPEIIPECVRNPCENGFAMYNNTCYKLESPGGPCKPIELGGGIFGVNTTTLKLECLLGTDWLSLFNVPSKCPPGSRRDNANRCRERFE